MAKKPLQVRSNPPAIAPGGNQGITSNSVPFGHNTDRMATGMSSYWGQTLAGLGLSPAPALHAGNTDTDAAAWVENMGNARFSEYMFTPAGQYVMYGLNQQQHLPVMEQANTESQFKAFILALNAAFRRSGGR